MFVDVCKSGTIGTIKSNAVNSQVENLKNVDGELLAMMSGRRRELSLEGPQYGGGHGAFSYFVLKGLEGAADENGDGVVDGNELIRYVTGNVPRATEDKQHPTDISPGNVDVKISDIHKPGINLARWNMLRDARNGETLYLASASPFDVPFEGQAEADTDQFTSAVSGGRLLPSQSDNAFDALQKLKGVVDPEQYQQRKNQLQIALENKAQQVLLRYLTGEETPQGQQEFLEGASYMEAARGLTQESLYLEGREAFFQGRALLFDKKFPEASQLLEQSVRIDPTGAYGYNALGISYLEQARFAEAIPAFRDASKRAPHWSYPLHNVALAYVETGDYRSAIRAYQEAIRLSPAYSYLPYNLGLVYQRLNRRKEAEVSYRKASQLAPNSAEPLNALGTLKAAEGKRGEAEQLYTQSLQKNPNLLPARHNLAILLAGEKTGQQHAIDLWRENLRLAPDYLPSRLSLAETLAQQGDNTAAIDEYRSILQSKPDYVAARIALGGLLAKTGNTEQALNELQEAAKRDSEDPAVLEEIGDLEAARQHFTEAKAAYDAALNLKPERSVRKRIESKRAKLT
jgi:tetratricopeptide (TPR) repeat protein